MNVKTDTKEKFRVITPMENQVSAIMAEELANVLLECRENEPAHAILNMEQVEDINAEALQKLGWVAKQFQSEKRSFVVCSFRKTPLQLATDLELLIVLNYAPTESEAWDILQMEEIEREFLGEEEDENNPAK
jgi:anti-anti-sigma regulatory factor